MTTETELQVTILALRERLAKIRDALAEIVISDGDDAGVVILDGHSTCHYDPELNCQVYDHEYFSPLGEALVGLAKLAQEPQTLAERDAALAKLTGPDRL